MKYFEIAEAGKVQSLQLEIAKLKREIDRLQVDKDHYENLYHEYFSIVESVVFRLHESRRNNA